MSKSHELSNFIWSIADLLRGPYRPPQYERVMLPLVVLRRFDCVLDGTKDAVLNKYGQYKDKLEGEALDTILNKASGQRFHNHSPLNFEKLKGDPEHIHLHLTGVTLRSEKDVNMFMAESLEGYKKCKAGDLVINTLWAWMGAMGVSPVDGIISPAYNVYRPVSGIDPDYIDLLVRTPDFICEITRYSKGVWSSRLRLYPEGLYEVCLPVPPLSEQKEIIVEINKQLKRFKELKSITEKTIILLQERRTALISAAVTGKLNKEILNAGIETQNDEPVPTQTGGT